MASSVSTTVTSRGLRGGGPSFPFPCGRRSWLIDASSSPSRYLHSGQLGASDAASKLVIAGYVATYAASLIAGRPPRRRV